MKLKFLLPLFLLISSTVFATEKPVVAATLNPIYQILLSIGGDKINAKLIIDPNLSDHDYQIKKKDLESITQADLIFYIDTSFETKIVKLIENFNLKNKSYPLSAISNIKCLNDRNQIKKLDPHLWLNPQNAIKIAEFMALKLSTIRPNEAKTFQKNFADFRQEILEVEKTTRASLRDIKGYVSYHDGLQYFEDYFGLIPAMVISNNLGHNLNIKDAKKLDQLVKAKKISCILGDAHDEKNFASTLAKNYNLQFLALNLMKGIEGMEYRGFFEDVTEKLKRCE